jgi:hypothetical protein
LKNIIYPTGPYNKFIQDLMSEKYYKIYVDAKMRFISIETSLV